MNAIDTIAAIATPSGRGGVGIIRISGPYVRDMAVDILGSLPPPFKASHRLFKDANQETLDDGVAIFFPSPNSFTGEDVLELQGHGGQIVLDMVLKRCLELGSRIAKPGEFSERAFLNDKLDLTQAEAIADLIDSGSEQAARSALRSLQGEFSSSIDSLLIKMIEMRVYVEAALDFPEEEIDFLADKKVLERLQAIKDQLTEITYKAKQGSLLRSGLNLVIIGEPNAGKSSLLNALSGNDTAIVTDIAGTTRDVLHESINLDGMPLHLVDTAGLRDSEDPVEKIGIERAWKAVEKADIALLLLGDTHLSTKSDEIVKKLPQSLPLIVVQNKIDLNAKDTGKEKDIINISAKYNLGIDILKEELKQRMGYQNNNEGIFIARRRHLQALERTQEFVDNAEMQLTEFNAGELMAEELRLAQDELSQITGKFTSDDLLGEIFSSFCIGK
ncbi:tRNA uridine-5-carboxymethylaminomethyl(34) synthesis GTPase MnmE [Cocleimonas sp. KMM 6892]|nr:tRNA uridine-5-carboxymethylaminomethyl(34) synthesis GTPase MnmE [Cocleimonas sp. KMM 6892]MEC4713867.1 tRNA uridine-5-carboxymethylaminomethyl(34) synthesis GTPase MnmE [Cocleimonas sp. KMM 6895]MEC4743198.1 tRNA uridine-5-carboxymethylaminomethyl(34) synthesis GTPase MnmE [Cocleimonas sp. KMM 6896]